MPVAEEICIMKGQRGMQDAFHDITFVVGSKSGEGQRSAPAYTRQKPYCVSLSLKQVDDGA